MSATPNDIFDDQRRRVALSKMLGRGGEGSVYEVVGDPIFPAKIYVPDKAKARREKILAMVQAKFYLPHWESHTRLDPFFIQMVCLLGSQCRRSESADRYMNSTRRAVGGSNFRKLTFVF